MRKEASYLKILLYGRPGSLSLAFGVLVNQMMRVTKRRRGIPSYSPDLRAVDRRKEMTSAIFFSESPRVGIT